MYVAKALVSVKQKGSGFKVKALQMFCTLAPPDKWKRLDAWVQAGWILDPTGTRSLVNQSATDRVLIVLTQLVMEPGDPDPSQSLPADPANPQPLQS